MIVLPFLGKGLRKVIQIHDSKQRYPFWPWFGSRHSLVSQVKAELIARGGYLLEGDEKERVNQIPNSLTPLAFIVSICFMRLSEETGRFRTVSKLSGWFSFHNMLYWLAL